MAVAMMVENPEASEEIYERVRALIGAQRPESCILHVAGPSPNGGFRVIELWDSEEEASRFFVERCLPAFEAVGVPVPPPPEFWPVHNRMYGERTNGGGETDRDTELEQAQAKLLAHYAPSTRIRRVRWSQGETQVLELGAGPPLLYVHGGLGGSFEVVPILGALAENHRVLEVDRPGHGLADPFDYRGVDLFDHGRTFLRDVVDGLELPTVDVVANSLGAFLSVAFALDDPSRVSRLALVGTPFGIMRRPPFLMLPLGLPLIGGGLAGTSFRMRRGTGAASSGPGHRPASRESRRSRARRRCREHATKRREHAQLDCVYRRLAPPWVSIAGDPRQALASFDDADTPHLGRTRRLRIAGVR